QWSNLEDAHIRTERLLNIQPTEAAIAGPKNMLMAKGADALGLEHRAIFRNVKNCVGLGRCLQGCPHGNKMSMERTLLPNAHRHGARVFANVSAKKILCRKGRACAVEAVSGKGVRLVFLARHAVVLSASAVQSPILLKQSGLKTDCVGKNFMCH